jgi:uncharacterized protein
MIARFVYSFYHAIRRRRCFAKVSQATMVCHIDLKNLQNQGVTTLVLDFDGVLAAHGETFPHPDAEQWLMQSIEIFGKEHVFILSNNPFQARQDYFKKLNIHFIISVRKKPYPDGLLEIARQTRQDKQQIVLIDDRLLTGILSTCLAQTRGILITQPYQEFTRRPFQESFFNFLRFLEQQLFL